MHVYTESTRHVPAPYIKHALEEWDGVRGPKRSWWYKIQLFNTQNCLKDQGKMLYFDLDTVIVGNIDWLWQVNKDKFWAARDFKYLMKSSKWAINSSVMWFDPKDYAHVYNEFDPNSIINNPRCPWHGDQDYIFEKVKNNVAFYNSDQILSYRWQVMQGGYDFRYRKHKDPGAASVVPPEASVLIFHGNPKPHEVKDNIISQHWC
jgi:lipopolysaccharide biosynthesis glycosyltransferase